ncbi:MAG: cyclic nucleotide-binding domain-containing protein [Elusimicrobiota bacterium]
MKKLKMAAVDFERLGQLLRKVDFFESLTVREMEKILPYVTLYQYKAGEKVFKEGTEGDAFYIIYDGCVSVRAKDKKSFFGFSQEVDRIEAGDCFGEMALLSNAKRNAAIVCEAPTRLFMLLASDFNYVLNQNPAFADKIAKIAEQRRVHRREVDSQVD